MNYKLFVLTVLVFIFVPDLQCAEPAKEELTIKLLYVVDGTAVNKSIISVGNLAFLSPESFLKYVSGLPSGTKITWSPGCCRIGGEPFISSEADMKSLRDACVKSGIELVIVPSG